EAVHGGAALGAGGGPGGQLVAAPAQAGEGEEGQTAAQETARPARWRGRDRRGEGRRGGGRSLLSRRGRGWRQGRDVEEVPGAGLRSCQQGSPRVAPAEARHHLALDDLPARLDERRGREAAAEDDFDLVIVERREDEDAVVLPPLSDPPGV